MIELRRILFPCDFSSFSRHALRQAVTVARAYKADVTALHVIPLTLVPSSNLPYYPNPILLDPGAQDQIRAALKRFVEPARTAGVPTEVEVREGDPVGQILEAAQGLPADLIVMGTHGRGGFERVVLGSVAEKVLRKAACAVWTTRPNGGSAESLQRILCPLDFSTSSYAALRYAASLAEKAGSRLILLHVLEAIAGYAPFREALTVADRARRETRVLEALTDLPEELRGWRDREAVVARGRPYREILRIARERKVDLIVMGVQGRGAIDLTLFGSVTHQVVRQSICPVLSVRSTVATRRPEPAPEEALTELVSP